MITRRRGTVGALVGLGMTFLSQAQAREQSPSESPPAAAPSASPLQTTPTSADVPDLGAAAPADGGNSIAAESGQGMQGKGAAPFLRLTAELSWLNLKPEIYGEREEAGLSTEFRRNERTNLALFGGRFETGLALRLSRSLTLAPRFSGAIHTNLFPQQELTIAGVEHIYSLRHAVWSLALGCEFQLLERLFLASFEAGAGGIFSADGEQASEVIDITSDDFFGFYSHAELGVRWPRDTPVGLGGKLGVDAVFSYLDVPDIFRVAAGLFVDVDWGRAR